MKCMKARWTFRIYPTQEQAEHLNRTFGCSRFVWNWALRMRSDGWLNSERISYAATDKALTQLKKTDEYGWLDEVSSVCLQQSLRDLQTAYTNFFEKRSGYPSFRRKQAAQSVNYTQRGFSFDPQTRTLRLAKIGQVKVRWSRKSVPVPTSIRVIRKPSGKFFISMVVDVEPRQRPKTGGSVGIDFGVSRLATLNNGELVANPKHSNKYQKRLALEQRRLARKKKGSKRRELQRKRVAKVHERTSWRRMDALHKFSSDIVNRYDTIYVEDLNLRGMVKNHSLARSLSDVGIGTAIRLLTEKAEQSGKQVIKINRWFPSSKTCSNCGHIVEKLPLSVREWTCLECQARHDRDINAAKNILAVGQTVAAHGGTVRRARTSVRERTTRRSANPQSVSQ